MSRVFAGRVPSGPSRRASGRLHRLVQLWVTGIVAAVAVTGASAIGWLEPLQVRTLDLIQRLGGQRFPPEVVIVAIDDAAFEKLGARQPIPRAYLARVLRGIDRSGAVVVGLDIALSVPTSAEEDAALAAAIRALAGQGSGGRHRMVLVDARLPESGPLADPGVVQATPRGSDRMPIDDDGVIRRVAIAPPGAGGGPVPAFALAILAQLDGVDPPAPTSDLWRINFVGPGGSFLTIPSDALAELGQADAPPVAEDNPLQDPEARRLARDVGQKRAESARLERALQAEQGKAPGEQRPQRIEELTRELGQTKGEYLVQVQAFLTRYPRYRAQFVEQQTVDPKAIAKFAERLPAGTLAVQYFAAPDALYLFVVAAGGKFQVRTHGIAQKDLYDLVRAYRTQLDRAATQRLPWTADGSEAYRRDVAPLKDLSDKLASHLLGPIESELGAHKDVIFFPNDLLLYLPIHALTRKQPDGAVRFLAETHRVSYVTQLELVDLLSPLRTAQNSPLLALANPDGTLPAASREVKELARIRPGVTALDGTEATKVRFLELAAKFSEIHLATHGVLDPEQPERSYLLLAGDDQASQRLTIGEIAGLSLPPNTLAILSGCETGLGEQVPGAALVTLAAAFSQAGSQSIVASLWKVSDVATRDFMVAFHRALPQAGRAGALQQAQLTLLGSPATAHPYYWAPFLLLGAR